MKILLVTHTFLPKYIAGTEVYTYNLAKELDKLGNKVIIFTTDPLNKFDDHKILKTIYDGISVYSLRKNIKLNRTFENTYDDKRSILPFKKLVEEIKPDVIHFQHIMHLSPELLKAGQSLKIPQIITLNDFWFQTMLFNRISSQGELLNNYNDEIAALDLSNIFGTGFFHSFNVTKDSNKIKYYINIVIYRILRKILYFTEKSEFLKKIEVRNLMMRNGLKTADLVIFPTLFMYQEFCRWGFEAKKTLISSHGINTEIFNNIKKTKSPTLRFGFIGSIIPAKGLDVLLKAWTKVSDPSVQLKVYGNIDSDKKYKNEIMKLGKNCKNIKFLGTFLPNQIAEVFSEIDVLILPSRWFENAPLVLRNALLSRTPVIATKLGSLIELVNEKGSGLLFENENSDDLAEKINSIIKDKKILNSFEFPRQKSVKENTDELIEIYSNFIKNNK